MKLRSALAAAFAAALLAAASGCTDVPAPPSPSLQSIDPPRGIAGIRTPVVLRGEGFSYRLVTSLSGSAPAADDVGVTVGGVALEDVTLRSETEITATIPPTLPVGVHDVALRFPDGRESVLAAAYEAEPPVALTLVPTPATLARQEQGVVAISITSRVDADLSLELEEAAVSPPDAFSLETPEIPATLAGRSEQTASAALVAIALDTVTVTEGLVSLRVRWTLGGVSGPSVAEAAVGLLPPARLDATLDVPAEVEVGDAQAVVVTLGAGEVSLDNVAVVVTVDANAELQPPLAVTGGTLLAGATATLSSSLVGLTPGMATLTLAASAAAERGAAPGPVSLERAVTVRTGPVLVIEAPTLPVAVEAGAAFPLAVTVRNDGDVDLAAAELTTTTTGGGTSPATTPLDLAAGASAVATVQVTPATAGQPVVLDLDASGQSAVSGRTFTASRVTVATGAALAPAALSLSAFPSALQAVVGQDLALLVTLSNAGEVEVNDATVAVTAGAGVVLVDGGTEKTYLAVGPFTLGPGAAWSANIPCRAKVVGTQLLALDATGHDALTGAVLTATASASLEVRDPEPPVVEILDPAPLAGLTVAPGASFQVSVGALADPGRTLTSITLSATGPAVVLPPPSVAVALRGTGASFTVQVNAGASDGDTITLTAAATDDFARTGTSPSSNVDVATTPTLVRVDCVPTVLRLFPGLVGAVHVEAVYSDGSSLDVTSAAAWSSSAPAVATVTAGLVVSVGAGSATITGTFGGLPGNCDATVLATTAYNVPERLALAPGGTAQVRHFAVGNPEPTDLTADPGTAWTTSDPGVATVAGGLVSGVGSGSALIEACSATACVITEVLVGADLELPGSLSAGPIGMSGAQHFESLLIRTGTVIEVVNAPLEISVDDSLVVEAGAIIRADGGDAPCISMSGPELPLRAEGGTGAPGGGGGGAGSGGNASNLCGGGNDNCGGAGDPPGQSACKQSACGGGNGGGPGAGGGSSPSVVGQAGDAGGGGGHGGPGGRGGRNASGLWAGAAGVTPGQTPLGGGSGGGGGDGSTGTNGSGGGGGGAGGVIRIAGLGATTILIDGTITARGGRGGGLHLNARSGPGGGAAGGLVEISAPAGTVGGVGRLVVAGGWGGDAGTSLGPCGGGGGGGGGRILVSAPVAAPFLLATASGGRGGYACTGGQYGEAGGRGVVQR